MAWHPFRNPGLKLLSVGLAVLLWMTVSRDAVVERSLRVPLEFRNVPAGLEIAGETPAAADVRLRGTSSMLARLEPGDIVAVLDLRGARPGERLFHLLTDEVRTPFGIRVTQVTPSTVSLVLEMRARKEVPVVPQVVGTPAAGFTRGRVSVDPEQVSIVGPESELALVDRATTEAVSIDGARRDVSDTVNIGVEDSSVRLVDQRAARVSVEIHALPIERTLHDVSVRFRRLAPGRSALVSPEKVSVVIEGPREAIAELTSGVVEPYVDLTDLGPGRYTLPVRTEDGGGFRVSRIEPERVSVRVR